MPNLLHDKAVPEASAEAQVAKRPVHERERCDRCGYRAYVEVILANGMNLTFCAHHYGRHEGKLSGVAMQINDDRSALG